MSGSSTSSTSSVSNGRYWGLASGLDVDSIVTGLLSDQQSKIDKVQQSEQKLTWKQTAYRTIISDLDTFEDAYLQLGSDTSMDSSDMYTSFTATSSNPVLSVTANSDATGVAQSISITQSAKTAALIGTDVGSSGLTGNTDLNTVLKTLHDYAFEAEVAGVADPSFSVTADGVTKSLSFSSSELSNCGTDTTKFVKLMNDKLSAAFGTVTPAAGGDAVCKVLASVGSNNTLSLSAQGGYKSVISVAGTTSAFNVKMINAYISVDADSTTATTPSMTVTYDGSTQKMDFKSADNLDTINLWLSQSFKDKGLIATADSNGAITIKNSDGKDITSITDSDGKAVNSISYDNTSLNPLELCGLTSNATNRMNTGTTLGTYLTSKGFTPSTDSKGNFSVNINGVAVSLNTNNSIADAFSAINSSSAGVSIAYNSTTDTVSLSATQSGAAGNITLSNTSPTGVTNTNTSGLFTALGIAMTADPDTKKATLTTAGATASNSVTPGQDAIFSINGTSFTRSSNTFALDGVTYKITGDVPSSDKTTTTSPQTATLTFTQDTAKLKKGLEGFISAYNTLIDAIHTQINTSPDSNYAPLTDAQKASMTSTQIDSWNVKAQAGMLYNDDTLQGICDTMRSALYSSVTLSNGSKMSLFDIGITTSDTASDYGKLEIKSTDQAKFANAIATNAGAIKELFTKSSAIALDIAPTTSAQIANQATRTKEEGLCDKLDDIIKGACGYSGSYGSLLQIAGSTTFNTYGNQIYKELKEDATKVTDLKTELKTKKNKLYTEFENLETYMEEANSQSSIISSFSSSS